MQMQATKRESGNGIKTSRHLLQREPQITSVQQKQQKSIILVATMKSKGSECINEFLMLINIISINDNYINNDNYYHFIEDHFRRDEVLSCLVMNN